MKTCEFGGNFEDLQEDKVCKLRQRHKIYSLLGNQNLQLLNKYTWDCFMNAASLFLFCRFKIVTDD